MFTLQCRVLRRKKHTFSHMHTIRRAVSMHACMHEHTHAHTHTHTKDSFKMFLTIFWWLSMQITSCCFKFNQISISCYQSKQYTTHNTGRLLLCIQQFGKSVIICIWSACRCRRCHTSADVSQTHKEANKLNFQGERLLHSLVQSWAT